MISICIGKTTLLNSSWHCKDEKKGLEKKSLKS